MLSIVDYSDSDEDGDRDQKSVEANGTGSACKSFESNEINSDVVIFNGNDVDNRDNQKLKGNKEMTGNKSETESDSAVDSDIEEQFSKSADLPLPDVFSAQSTAHKCNRKRKRRGDQHAGRKRTFEHVDGNWPTYVYVSIQHTQNFQAEFDTILKSLRQRFVNELHVFPLDSCHISLSRTVPIRHYWIEPMLEKLKSLLRGMKTFYFSFDSVHVYTNDDKTRTFIGFQISHGSDRLKSIVEKTDQVYKDFDLPLYYSEPSFHVSIAWLLGDRKDEVGVYLSNNGMSKLKNEILYQNVDSVCMKTGNKVHTVPLL